MSPKVLFVDDEIAILNGIKLNLGRTFEISLANGADEALKMMEEDGPFEVIVSDMRMPGRSGVEVLAHAKSMQPDVMTILLTGHADFEFGGSQALSSGQIFRILSKPCPPDKIKEAISAAIRAKQRKEGNDSSGAEA
jgi:DNA-binding NtrC family response regulator